MGDEQLSSRSSVWFEDVGRINGPQKSPISNDANPATIIMVPFHKPANISFGEVKMGSEKIATLRLENPGEVAREVWFENFPYEKGLQLDGDGLKYSVPADGSVLIHVKWTPISAGKFSHVLPMKGDGNFRSRAIILGTAVDTVQKKKRLPSTSRPKLATLYPANTGKTRKARDGSLLIKPTIRQEPLPKLGENSKSSTIASSSAAADSCLSKPTTKSEGTVTEAISELGEQCADFSNVIMRGTFVIQPVPTSSSEDNVNYQFLLTPERRLTYTRQLSDGSPKIVPRKVMKHESEPKVSSIAGDEDALDSQTYICPKKDEFASVTAEELPSCDALLTPCRRQTYTKFNGDDDDDDAAEMVEDCKLEKMMLSTVQECNDSMEISILPNVDALESDDAQNIGHEDVSKIEIEEPGNTEQDNFQENLHAMETTSNAQIEDHNLPRFPASQLRNLDDNSVQFSPDIMTMISKAFRPRVIGVQKPLEELQQDGMEAYFNSSKIVLGDDAFELMPPPGQTNLPKKMQRKPGNYPWRKPNPTSRLALPDLHREELEDDGPKPVEVVGDISGIESISTEFIYKRMHADSTFGSSLSICDANICEIDPRRCSTACKENLPILQALCTPILAQSTSLFPEEQSSQAAEHESRAESATFTINLDMQKHRADEEKKKTVIIPRSTTFVTDSGEPSGINPSSKSTSNTVVADRLKRKSARSPFFRKRSTAQEKLVLLHASQETAIPRHPNPFASMNTFYDELWRDKQEAGFTKWINYILTPPDDLNSPYSEEKSCEARKLWLQSLQNDASHRAPSRECMSLKIYTAIKRLNDLRCQAIKLYQSPEVARVVQKIELEISTSHLKIRKDKALSADIGMKEFVLKLLLGYNTLWLRIGVETILGEVMILQSNEDKPGIIRFIKQKFLFDSELAKRFAHATVQQHYREGYEEAYKKLVLRRILLLIYLLDCAKQAQIIQHDPCLFNKDAVLKTSRAVLIEFSRTFMGGEGDFIKHLRLLGYSVSYEQKPLHEFEFATDNVAVDLRDGLRLARVLQLLTGDPLLLIPMRVPAVSRNHKIHNVGVTLKAMSNLGCPIDDILPKDIVDGNRDKTLALLWHIVLHFQLGVIINENRLQNEIRLLKRTFYQREIRNNRSNIAMLNTEVDCSNLSYGNQQKLLLSWCNAVCMHYDMKVRNFTVSFSDGRAFCYLVHHYHPNLLPLSEIATLTTHTYSASVAGSSSGNLVLQFDSAQDVSATSADLLANEQRNIKLAFKMMTELGGVPIVARSGDMSNTIPDDKITITQVAYLCSRLLGLGTEIRAARIIQCAWRKYTTNKLWQGALCDNNPEETKAIQHDVLDHKTGQEIKEKAAVVIQKFWRGRQGRCLVKSLKAKQENNRHWVAVVIERWLTVLLIRKKAAIIIQRFWRDFRVRKQKQMEDNKIAAAIVIQKYHRGSRARLLKKDLCMQVELEKLQEQRNLEQQILKKKIAAITVIQKHWRGHQARIIAKRLKIQIEKQKLQQIYFERQILEKKVAAVTVIQKSWRGYQARKIAKCMKMEVEMYNVNQMESSFFSCYSHPRRSGLVELDIDASSFSESPRSSLCNETMAASLYESFHSCVEDSMSIMLEKMTPNSFSTELDSVIHASLDKTITAEETTCNISIKSEALDASVANGTSHVDGDIDHGKLIGPLMSEEVLVQNADAGKDEFGTSDTLNAAGDNFLNSFEEIVGKMAQDAAEQPMSSSHSVDTPVSEVKTSFAFLLRCRNLTTILGALLDLEKGTRDDVSRREFCMSSTDMSKVLVTIMTWCNRSVPHNELIALSIDIFCNIAKSETLLQGLWDTEKLVETLFKLMGIYCASAPFIFIKCCRLVKTFATAGNFYVIMQHNKSWMDKIISLHAIASRRFQNAERLRIRNTLTLQRITSCDNKYIEDIVQPAAMIFELFEIFNLKK